MSCVNLIVPEAAHAAKVTARHLGLRKLFGREDCALTAEYQPSGEVAVKGVRFFTDSAVLTPAWKVPMILCGPGHAELAHQPDEFVEISLLEQAVEIYTLALIDYLG